jgi:oligoendopeptidase F
MAVSLPKRSEVPEKYTWNLANIFPSEDAWRKALDEIMEDLPKLTAYKGRLGESAQTLADWFRDYQDIQIKVGKVFVYTSMLSDTDTSNQEWLAMRDQTRGAFARFAAGVSFVEPEMLAIPQERIEEFMREEPKLEEFRH